MLSSLVAKAFRLSSAAPNSLDALIVPVAALSSGVEIINFLIASSAVFTEVSFTLNAFINAFAIVSLLNFQPSVDPVVSGSTI